MRTGIGYDAHRLVPQRPLILGGVSIPSSKGLAGHSDGDVLRHAIIDALLGAAALGDIGKYFPSEDPRYAGISSLEMLSKANAILREDGWRVLNVDATIVAQSPKLAPYFQPMIQSIAACLGVEPARVSVKATTTDGLGFTGDSQGIACFSVASIEPES